MENLDKTIVAFHIQTTKSFIGTKNMLGVLGVCEDGGKWSFIHERDCKGRFCSPYYADCNGNFLISVKEVNTGVGILDWDGYYNTYYCQYLDECNEEDLILILNSSEWNSMLLIEEYFNNYSNLKVDWKRFNGNYSELITAEFNFPNFDVEILYE